MAKHIEPKEICLHGTALRLAARSIQHCFHAGAEQKRTYVKKRLHARQQESGQTQRRL